MIGKQLPRIASIDILRALTMALMIFVNDFWTLKDIPQWLEHTKAAEDAMGFSDLIFPAFLVIVGMSVPFSIASRRNKGESPSSIVLHIILRSFALLVMGLFLVNGENFNDAATGMPRSLWVSLACLSFILIWNAYSPSINKRLVIFLKIIGWLILLILAWIYKGGEDASLHFSTFWWGILGLIGWAYLVSALVYVFTGPNILFISMFWLLCISFCAVTHAGFVPQNSFLLTLTSPLANGAMPAFVTAGMASSLLFIKFQKLNKPYQLIIWLVVISLLLVAAGFLIRPLLAGISKIRATPAWVLICTGITISSFALIYWLADIKQKAKWFDLIKPAGTNTLLVYLLPYFVYAIIYSLLNTAFSEIISTGMIGLLKSFLFSLVIVQIGGLLAKAGLRLKL